jgi:hypothetical protein
MKYVFDLVFNILFIRLFWVLNSAKVYYFITTRTITLRPTNVRLLFDMSFHNFVPFYLLYYIPLRVKNGKKSTEIII